MDHWIGTIGVLLMKSEFHLPPGQDWILASFENQKENPSFLSKIDSLLGPPSFISDRDFTIFSGEPFYHKAEATVFSAYVGNGLPTGLLLKPIDGNLSGSPPGWNLQPNLRHLCGWIECPGKLYFMSGKSPNFPSVPQSGASSIQVP